MKKVFVAENIIEAGLMKGLLEGNGISCLVKNQNLSGAIGEIPPLECWPELWVTDDEDHAQAQSIIQSAMASEDEPPWVCSCGENIEGQFSSCWNCGGDRTPSRERV